MNQKKFYIKREYEKIVSSDRFEDDKKRLQGFYPIYLPQDSVLSKKVIFAEHKRSLHGGVALTMSHVRSLFWIPHLRRLSKSVIRNCYGSKKSRSLPYHSPKPGPLAKDRTEICFPFEVIGTNYAGQIYYKTKKKNEVKAYILLFSCSITRAVDIALVSNLTTTEFIKSFKRLISRRGKSKIVSLIMPKLSRQGINRDHKLHNFLSSETILWKFNVPKVPWWGGQFKRLIGLTKANFYRTIGKAPLTWEKLEEVLLGIEIILNIRPLTYIEEEIDYPILTPNSLILGCDVNFPDAAPHESESETIKKRHKYIKR